MQTRNTLNVIPIWVALLMMTTTHPAWGDWVARYNGTGDGADSARALALDGEGNVFVTGESQGSTRAVGYATLKYAPDGSLLWVNRYEGLGNGSHRPCSLAVDGAGGVVVTGTSTGSTSRSDFVTLKYDREGRKLWEARYNGLRNGADIARAVSIDPEGSVYVSGVAGSKAFALVKYDPDGNLLWAREREMSRKGADLVSGMGTDSSGSVYLVGNASPKGRSNTVVLKWSSSGELLWERWYTGAAIRFNWPQAMAVNAAGHVHVAGTRINGNWSSDYLILKYDADGALLWGRAYRLGRNVLNDAYSLALDPFDNVYVTGTSYRISSDIQTTHLRTVTVKYDPAGNLLWEAPYFGTKEAGDYLIPRIAVDAAGNAYVAKALKGQGGSQDYVTMKFDAGGILNWVKTYNGEGKGADQPCGITVDASMSVFVTGRSQGVRTLDFATVKYSQP